MKLEKRFASILLLVGLLVGGLVAGIAFTGSPAPTAAQSTDACVEDDDSQGASETEDADDVQEEVECGPQDEDEADEDNEANESDTGESENQDAVVPADWSGLSLDQAKAIAQAANPGAVIVAAEFEHESGMAAYEVEMDNGVEMVINAMSGEIIHSESDSN